MARETVGMIGLGIMGSAMSANLIKAGFEVVGYDVVDRCRNEHRKAGGTVASDCAQVSKRCSVWVTVVGKPVSARTSRSASQNSAQVSCRLRSISHQRLIGVDGVQFDERGCCAVPAPQLAIRPARKTAPLNPRGDNPV